MQRNKIQNLTLIAFMAAILCVAGPLVIPIGMVPMSFANMAIYLTVLLLDKRKATISVAIYLLIGFTGVPVFSGFTAGAGKLLGPTGGYLIGYLGLSWIAGEILEAFDRKPLWKKHQKNFKNLGQMMALAAGTIILYLVGTVWLMVQNEMDFVVALSIGVLPFVVFDAVKIVAAVILANAIKKRIGTQLN